MARLRKLKFLYLKLRRNLSQLWQTIQADQSYQEQDYWDSWYSRADSHTDSTTIDPDRPEVSYNSIYHYNMVENAILDILIREDRVVEGVDILDIGSGAGHWIDFWDGLEVKSVTGLEISEVATEELIEKYKGKESIYIYHEDISDLKREYTGFEYICAVGVLFHIVEDEQWESAVREICNLLEPNGIALIGGEFGYLSRNVQFNKSDGLSNGSSNVTKRLRSKSEWREQIQKHNCKVLRTVKNEPPKHVHTPQNNILAIEKCCD